MAKKTTPKTREELAGYNDFSTVFQAGAVPYPPHLIEAINHCRKQLGGNLFFDLLLHSVGIEKGIRKLYPPKDVESLKHLHHQIIQSPADASQKQALLYYLLLNSPDLHGPANTSTEHLRDGQGRAQEAQDFANHCLLPSSYSTVSFGFWLMDRMRFMEALNPLLDPSIQPTLPEEVLMTLVKLAKPEEHNLALVYYDAINPKFTTQENLKCFYALYCRVSVTQALFFARRQESDSYRILIEELARSVITDPVSSKASKGDNATEFINLPFNTEELVWLTAFLKEGDLAGTEQANGTLEMINMSRGLVDASHSRLLGFPPAPKSEIWQGLQDRDSIGNQEPLLLPNSFDISKALS